MTDDLRKTTPPSWASLYDDQNADLSVHGDLGPSYHPDDQSTASRIAKAHRQRTRDAATARRMANLQEDAEVYLDDQARDRVRDDIAHGRSPTFTDQVRASRSLARDPNRPRLSSAEKLARGRR